MVIMLAIQPKFENAYNACNVAWIDRETIGTSGIKFKFFSPKALLSSRHLTNLANQFLAQKFIIYILKIQSMSDKLNIRNLNTRWFGFQTEQKKQNIQKPNEIVRILDVKLAQTVLAINRVIVHFYIKWSSLAFELGHAVFAAVRKPNNLTTKLV